MPNLNGVKRALTSEFEMKDQGTTQKILGI